MQSLSFFTLTTNIMPQAFGNNTNNSRFDSHCSNLLALLGKVKPPKLRLPTLLVLCCLWKYRQRVDSVYSSQCPPYTHIHIYLYTYAQDLRVAMFNLVSIWPKASKVVLNFLTFRRLRSCGFYISSPFLVSFFDEYFLTVLLTFVLHLF